MVAVSGGGRVCLTLANCIAQRFGFGLFGRAMGFDRRYWTAASVRHRTCSLSYMRIKCALTVPAVIVKRTPISLFERPSASKARISISREDNLSFSLRDADGGSMN